MSLENKNNPVTTNYHNATLSTSDMLYIQAATSNNTRLAYQKDIRHFRAWGGLLPTTADKLIQYLHYYANSLSPKTLKRRLVAIKHWHTYQGFSDPTANPLIHKTMVGIKKVHGRPPKQAKALSLETLQLFTDYLKQKPKLIHIRNNALLQVGFFGALRRSELVAICWEHINLIPHKGIELLIPHSKTDQEGEGQICALPYGDEMLCPVTALEEWQHQSELTTGYVFPQITKGGTIKSNPITPARINIILKELAYDCKLDEPLKYSGHSLRRGFATTASQNQAPLTTIMRQGRWRHEKTVLEYIEAGQRFDENAAQLIFKNRKALKTETAT